MMSARASVDFPTRHTYNVNHVNVLPAFIFFPLDPVSIEIRKESIDVGGSGGVTIPFLRVVVQQRFVRKIFRFLSNPKPNIKISSGPLFMPAKPREEATHRPNNFEMINKVRIEMFVQVRSHQIRST